MWPAIPVFSRHHRCDEDAGMKHLVRHDPGNGSPRTRLRTDLAALRLPQIQPGTRRLGQSHLRSGGGQRFVPRQASGALRRPALRSTLSSKCPIGRRNDHFETLLELSPVSRFPH